MKSTKTPNFKRLAYLKNGRKKNPRTEYFRNGRKKNPETVKSYALSFLKKHPNYYQKYYLSKSKMALIILRMEKRLKQIQKNQTNKKGGVVCNYPHPPYTKLKMAR